MRRAAILTSLALAGCGGTAAETAPPPSASPPPGGDAEGSPQAGAVGVPDGGQAAGHGADDARRRPGRREVRVPDRDTTPPLALLRLAPAGGARPVIHRSPVQARRAPAVRLARPGFRATAIIRDDDGGTGRIRITVRYDAACEDGRRGRTLHLPPSQIERIRLTPGTRAPVERRRSARVRLPARCRVSGEAFADATNAHGLESFSDPVRFVFAQSSRPGE